MKAETASQVILLRMLPLSILPTFARSRQGTMEKAELLSISVIGFPNPVPYGRGLLRMKSHQPRCVKVSLIVVKARPGLAMNDMVACGTQFDALLGFGVVRGFW